jgi:hypothetical protein
MRGIEWSWTDQDRYVAFTRSIQRDKNVATIALPGSPAPTAILSSRLVDMIRKMPSECRLDARGIRAAVWATCDRLHVRFGGVDLRQTILVDEVPFGLGKGNGATWTLPVIVVWHAAAFTMAACSEFRLSEEHYVDRWLLLTELNHRCQDEE